MKQNNLNVLIAISLIAVAVSMRVINAEMNLPNFAPIGAIGLFSAAILRDKRVLALSIPFLGQFAADLYFHFFTSVGGFYPGMGFNYAALLAATCLGFGIKEMKPVNILGFILGASTIFFLISNLGYFISGYNGYSFAGFTKTYIDAIPFYKNTLVGDLVGGVVLFSAYFAAQAIALQKAKRVQA
jgi:hypothetical protein